MKSRISGILVFLFATIFGVTIYLTFSQGRFYRGHFWMMNPYWMMGSGILFVLVLFGLVGFVLFRYPLKKDNRAFQVLQHRFANGDITEEEYNQLKDILKEA
jgi:uncharacterized membrane protein